MSDNRAQILEQAGNAVAALVQEGLQDLNDKKKALVSAAMDNGATIQMIAYIPGGWLCCLTTDADAEPIVLFRIQPGKIDKSRRPGEADGPQGQQAPEAEREAECSSVHHLSSGVEVFTSRRLAPGGEICQSFRGGSRGHPLEGPCQ